MWELEAGCVKLGSVHRVGGRKEGEEESELYMGNWKLFQMADVDVGGGKSGKVEPARLQESAS